jgi:hypothetical protein
MDDLYKFEYADLNLTKVLEDIDYKEELNEDELEHAENIFKTFLDFCEQNGIIKNYDEEKVEQLLEECKEK